MGSQGLDGKNFSESRNMKNILILFAICLILTKLASAYDPAYDAYNPEDMGSVTVISDGAGFPSTITRWKSTRIQSTASGTATHFIIRVGSNNIGSVPIGFAVYSGTSGERDPIGRLLIRGYYPSFTFTRAGYYALPFTSAEGLEISAGQYYHLAYLLTPGDEQAESGWRISADNPPPKWFSDCKGDACNADEPPGVGEEFWNGQYWPSSAGWAMGLLDSSTVLNTPPGTDSGDPIDSSGDD